MALGCKKKKMALGCKKKKMALECKKRKGSRNIWRKSFENTHLATSKKKIMIS